MNAIVELLDPVTQTQFREALGLRQALTGEDIQRFAEVLDDETLAALAVVGQHPANLRSVAVALMPTGQRVQAFAHKLVIRHDGESRVWALSDTGDELCSVLAAAVPETTEADQRRAARQYAALLAEADEDLQLDAEGRPREKS
jgi:hypothetical protein